MTSENENDETEKQVKTFIEENIQKSEEEILEGCKGFGITKERLLEKISFIKTIEEIRFHLLDNQKISTDEIISSVGLENNDSNKTIIEGQRKFVNQQIKYLGVVTTEELLERDIKIEWIVANYVPKKGITMFGGMQAGFKSMLAEYLAVCVASGNSFLGHLTHKKRVCFIDEENGWGILKARFKKIAKGMGLKNNPKIFWYPKTGFCVEDKEKMKKFEAYIRTNRIEVIIVDVLSRIRNGDDNDAQKVNELYMSFLSPLSEKYGISWVLLHHAKKPPKGDYSIDADDLRGSSELRNIAHSIMLFERKSKNELILKHVKLREQEAQTPMMVHVDFDDEEGLVKFSTHDMPVKQKKLLDKDELAPKMLEFIKKKKITEFETTKVRDEFEDLYPTEKTRTDALNILIEQGHVERIKKGFYKVVIPHDW